MIHNFNPDPEERAMFAKFAESAGPTGAATRASAKAAKTGKATDHYRAADAHHEAYKYHKEEGNTEMAKAHYNAARSHERSGRLATNSMSRSGMLGMLTANCNHEEQLALAELSDATLRRLIRNARGDPRGGDGDGDDDEDEECPPTGNAKAEGSNADVTGSGDFDSSEQAGGEETTKEHGYESEDEFTDKALRGAKKKAPATGVGMPSLNQWLNATNAPPELRRIVNEHQQNERREKARIVNQLKRIAAGAAPNKKVLIENTLGARPGIEQLRNMLTLASGGGEPLTNDFQPRLLEGSAQYLGASGGPVENVQVENSDDMDMLPLPTMTENDWKEMAKEGRSQRGETAARVAQ